MKKNILCIGMLVLVHFAYAGCNDPARPGVDWSGCDKKGINLSRVNLSNANLTNTNLANAHLSGVNFTNATLKDANLSGAYLYSVGFYDVIGTNINFSKVRIKKSNFDRANLAGSNFTDSKLEEFIDFTGANLSSTQGITLRTSGGLFDQPGTVITNATLMNASIMNGNGDEIICGNDTWRHFYQSAGANLSNVRLTNGRQCKENSIGCCKL